MTYDEEGNVVTSWPITGLAVGQDSQHLILGWNCPAGPLSARDDENAKFMARRAGTSDAFVDLALNPIPLSGLSGRILFEVFVRAIGPVVEFERIPLSVGPVSSGPAQWDT